MKATDIDLTTDFSHYDEPERSWCETLQAKMRELLYPELHPELVEGPVEGLPTKNWRDDEELWGVAAKTLGNADQRYCQIYACETCKKLYHGDYSTSNDPDHDYCGADCQPERSHRRHDV